MNINLDKIHPFCCCGNARGSMAITKVFNDCCTKCGHLVYWSKATKKIIKNKVLVLPVPIKPKNNNMNGLYSEKNPNKLQ